jgi:transglutaminase-like putative cysteine protease
MTATLPRPEAPSTGGPSRRPTPPTASAGQLPLLAIAEVALTALTVAAVLGLGRLFEDGSFLLPVLTVTCGAHALAAWCRRARLGGGATALVATGGLVAVVSLLLLPATTAYGFPTPATLAEVGAQLAAAMETFREVVAPAPVEPGFVLATAVAVWIIAFVADTAAFRVGAVVEAAVPGATLFVFGAALGAPRQREVTTALFLAGLLAYWLAQRALANAASPTWLTRDTVAGSRALLRVGAGLGAVVVVAAVVGGPMLPGASAGAAVPWRASDRDGGSRVTVSPLVDIRARIVDQAASVVFTVASPVRSYWRLTSLETFNGRIWSSTRSYQEADGELDPGSRLAPTSTQESVQEFEIGSLSSIWLPAAYRPVRVDGTSASYDPESGSLIVPEELDVTQVGQRYSITSVLPQLTADGLGAAPADAPEEVTDGYTELPDGFSTAVQQEALRVTSTAGTPYEQALALQDHFRDGTFTYDLEVERGHSGDALERFLFETRSGYCEQFAGAYAAMARAVGLPARVAVGFTPGELGPDGRYVVRGANGHAWPEVYLEGYGWVPFEPTPGRGIPGATPYTGVPEQQADATDPTTGTTLAPAADALPADPTAGAPTDPVLPEGAFEGMFQDGAAPIERASPWPGRLVVAGLLAVGLPALWVGAVAVATLVRRSRRRALATTARARVGVAWAEVGEALATVDAGPRSHETPGEVASRAASAVGTADPGALADLARTTTVAAYAPDGVDDGAATVAQAQAGELVRGISATMDGRQRLRRALDPRPLLPARVARRRVGGAAAVEDGTLIRA